MRGYTSDMRTAPLMTVVSASGGAGKSTIALLCACLAARAGVKTTLLEGDLQFGDYGVWLGLDEELPEAIRSELPDVPSVFISAISGYNLQTLKDMLWEALQKENA